jgi:predicted RNA-binding Zn ribbon-like protein
MRCGTHWESFRWRPTARIPEHAAAILSAALELRETLYGIFNAASQRKASTRKDLQHLNQTLEQAPLRFEVRREKKGFPCERRAAGTEFATLLGPVAWSAAELLTSENCELIKCCASDTCCWLFLDSTKNRSRRWCNMADCGSRAKARRYYQRKTRGLL